MKTLTYTAPATAPAALKTPNRALAAFVKVNTFLNVFFGATAEQDSNFRGLDLNGNPMWATKR